MGGTNTCDNVTGHCTVGTCFLADGRALDVCVCVCSNMCYYRSEELYRKQLKGAQVGFLQSNRKGAL